MPILLKHLPCHDQLEYATVAEPGHEAVPIRWRGMEADFDWSCTAARSRRFNNRIPGSVDGSVTHFNSGYFAAVLVSPAHAVVCAHYRRVVPSQAGSLRFIGRTGSVHLPRLAAVHEQVGMDLDLLEFEQPLPNDVGVCSRIADLRDVKRGLPVILQTSQHMSVCCLLDQVAVIQETNGARFATAIYIKPQRNGVDDIATDGDGDPVTFSGDSGSPILSLDRDGCQCLVGLFAGGGAVGIGGTRWPGNAFDTIASIVGKRGYQVHAVEIGSRPLRFSSDVTGDGQVDGADLASVITQWGQAGLGDVNRDGVVNGADLSEVLAGWSS